MIPTAKWDDRDVLLEPVGDEWFEAKLSAKDAGAGKHILTLTPAPGTPKAAAWLDMTVVAHAAAK